MAIVQSLITTGSTNESLVHALPFEALVSTGATFEACMQVLPNVALMRTGTSYEASAYTGTEQVSDLVLAPILVSQSSDGLSGIMGDDTGEYPASEGGYEPEAGTGTAMRPKRSQLALYGCYRRYTPTTKGDAYFPAAQDATLVPWQLDVDFEVEQGIYMFYLIGAPYGTNLEDVAAPDGPERALDLEGWYVGQTPVLIAPKLLTLLADAEDRLAILTTEGSSDGTAQARDEFDRHTRWASGLTALLALGAADETRLNQAAYVLERWDADVNGL